MKILRIAFLMGSALAISASAPAADSSGTTTPAAFDCQTQPGSQICQVMEDVRVEESQGCNGPACFAQWQNIATDEGGLLQLLETTLTPADTIGADMGAEAKNLAMTICGAVKNGLDQNGFNAVNAENRLLPHLQDLQLRAGINEVTICSVVIH